jgi:hypothetical protein
MIECGTPDAESPVIEENPLQIITLDFRFAA